MSATRSLLIGVAAFTVTTLTIIAEGALSGTPLFA